MLDDPLRGSGLLEENGCITTVPEWREVGHVRGGGLSLVHLLYGRMREAEKKIHVRELVKDIGVWDRHILYKFYITLVLTL